MTPLKNRSAGPMPAILALVALLLLAACGSAGQTSGPGSDASAGDGASQPADGGTGSGGGDCDLWTLDEVSAAAGVEVTDTLGSEQQGQSACNFNDADGLPIATYVVMTSDAPISPSAGYDAISEGTEPVSGVGDQAKWAEITGGFGSLYVMSGGNLYIVSILSDISADEKRDASVELAQLLIDRHQ